MEIKLSVDRPGYYRNASRLIKAGTIATYDRLDEDERIVFEFHGWTGNVDHDDCEPMD